MKNGMNKWLLPRLGLAALLLVGGVSVPASAQVPTPGGSAVTINADGTVSRVATVSGTFTAPAEVGTVIVRVVVIQSRQGAPTVQAFTDVGPIVADGTSQSWAATLAPDTAFKPGDAQVIVKLLRSDGSGLAGATATVQLTSR